MLKDIRETFARSRTTLVQDTVGLLSLITFLVVSMNLSDLL
jgi:hypothetical protein